MDDCFQIVPFTRIWRTEEIDETHDEFRCHIVVVHLIRLEVLQDDYSEQELIDDLDVRPLLLQHYLLFFGIVASFLVHLLLNCAFEFRNLNPFTRLLDIKVVLTLVFESS